MADLSNDILSKAIQILQSGGIVALPTEGVYGLSCLPSREESIQKLCQIKRRDPYKGLILVASSTEQLSPYITELSAEQYALLASAEPITWLVPAKPDISKRINGGKAFVAVRISRHPVLQEICQALKGPVISTSANRADAPPALSAAEVASIFSEAEIDYIVDAPLGGLGRPTEIRDLQSHSIIRH